MEVALTLSTPSWIKPWEKDARGEIRKHPLCRGPILKSEPSTWANRPALPEKAGEPLEGVWLVGPNGEYLLATGLWVFKSAAGTPLEVTDHDVKWKGSRAIAVGKAEATEMIGDLGHPTLAAWLPGNDCLAALLAGDFRLWKDGTGNLHLDLNNISGRYSKAVDGHTAALDETADALAEIFGVKKRHLTKHWVSPPYLPGPRSKRYASKSRRA